MNIADAIIHKSDIVDYISKYTELVREGDIWRGVCPIHDGQNKRALMVSIKSKLGIPIYYCHVCGHSGSIINFVADINKISYFDAVIKLADELNIDTSIDPEFHKMKSQVELNEYEAKSYHKDIDSVREHLNIKRGLTDETICNFNLGYQSNGIVIPLRDVHGQTIAFAIRKLVGEPKYINSKNNFLYDKGAYLFNLDRAKKNTDGQLYMVEGYFDAMSADQQGLACVAYCGITMTKEHIGILKGIAENIPNFTVIFCPDQDGVAINGVEKVRQKFLQYAPEINVEVGLIDTDHKDFSDLHVAGLNIKDNVTHIPIDLYCLENGLNKCTNPQMEYKFTEKFMRSVPNPMIKLDIIDWLAHRWDKKADDLREWFKVSDSKNIDDYLEEFKGFDTCVDELKELLKSGYIPFGFPNLDKQTKGGRKGEVIIGAAYAGVAKTHFAINVMLYQIVREKRNIICFSLEMTAGALYERIIANLLGKSTEQVEQMILSGDPLIYQLRDALSKHLFVVDKNNLSIKDVREFIQIANTRVFDVPTDCIIIDYLQYMKGTKTFEEISETARELKAVAKDYNMIVIALSQLSRQGSPWVKPTLQMLKGSGDIEASADLILGMWRPGLEPTLSPIDKDALKKQVMLGILKFRRGTVNVDEFELEFSQGGKLKEVLGDGG